MSRLHKLKLFLKKIKNLVWYFILFLIEESYEFANKLSILDKITKRGHRSRLSLKELMTISKNQLQYS